MATKLTHFGAAMLLGATLMSAGAASANTFAAFNPSDDTANVSLTGLALSATSPVVFEYTTAPLAPLGDLAAQWTMSATETGALAFGPLALATFDGSFALTYTGPKFSAGGYTVVTGQDLLSGTFLGSVFTGYGSSAALADSLLGGGLVDYKDNPLISFTPAGGDEGIGLAFGSLSNPVVVVGGTLSDFTGAASGAFAADNVVSPRPGPPVPEPATWALMILGFAGLGAVLRGRRSSLSVRGAPPIGDDRMTLTKLAAGTAFATMAAMVAGGTEASTFASYSPAGNTANVSLTGLALSAASQTTFQYKIAGLSNLGKLKASWTMSATETGALGFGPLALGTFDGSFTFAYAGPTRTVSGHTVHAGDTLLSGTFLGSVFTGYGSSATLADSLLGGGLVDYRSNPLISFTPTGGDEGLAMTYTSLHNPVAVVGGTLTDFTAVGAGNFSADNAHVQSLTPSHNNGGASLAPTSAPEPAAWTLMLIGFGAVGALARRGRRSLVTPT